MRHRSPASYNRCMNDSCRLPLAVTTPTATKWSVGGRLLEAMASRDYAQMSDCLEPAATMRALLPRGPAEFQGAAQIVEAFRGWFGNAEGFEVLGGTVGEVGGRLHVAWRLHVRPTPRGDERWHVIEQQAYLRADERIDAIDLLCSGFIPDGHS